MVLGKVHANNNYNRFWVMFGLAYVVQRDNGTSVMSRNNENIFDEVTEDNKVSMILDAGVTLLKMNLYSNGQGRSSQRCERLSDVMGYQSGRESTRFIDHAHGDLINRIERDINSAGDTNNRFKYLVTRYDCVQFMYRDDVESLDFEELKAEVFFRTLILEKMGLFDKVCNFQIHGISNTKPIFKNRFLVLLFHMFSFRFWFR